MENKPKAEAGDAYDHASIEKKWQKWWAASGIYAASEGARDKYYVLDMFPYPSGEGLHVGHPKGYIATDVISRMKRMQGKNVLHPMGFDAFGLPAENYAIKTKTNPEASVTKNIARYKQQLEILGLDYDWSREVNTTDPAYYRWTQWIFLQMWKKGLAFESNEPVNWCPTDKTVLANEDVEDGRCERCGSLVEKKPLRQWVLKITDYADRLLADLDATDYVMPKLIDKVNPHQPGKPLIKRSVAHAIVYNPKTKKYLIIRNKKHGWDTVVIGGIEGSETPEQAARREVCEETGYTDLEFKRILGGPTEAHYYTKHKGENRIAYAQAAYFELKSDARVPLADGEDSDNEILWIDAANFIPGKMVNSELPIWLERLEDPAKGYGKPILDWPESIKEAQKNWIGRSEGALISFKVKNARTDRVEEIDVFTTRPDTLYGVTYIVLAPEHKMVAKLLGGISNSVEAEAYIAKTKSETDIERTDATKEKTGVELKGIKAVNPVNGEEVPVWIADYVLADYGTGAVMAVPAHDDRDFAFAKKYGLAVKQVIAPYFQNTTTLIPRADLPIVRRRNIHAIVKHPTRDAYLFVQWKNDGWKSLVTGGIEEGEDAVAAARREVLEETGYKNLKHIPTSGSGREVHSYFFAKHKNENRYMAAQGVVFELVDEEKAPQSEEERSKYDVVWVESSKARDFLSHINQKLIWDYCMGDFPFTGSGRLVNSGPFTDKDSDSIKRDITIAAGGRWVAKYKLRDWVFSRQRYWGEPIPLIHCNSSSGGCGVVPVPENELPVKLPPVESYEPTGTGESPLAAISDWVNVTCPSCGGPARRETNTMPQWAGSSWYYLRYMDPANSSLLVDLAKEKYWSPVDLYVGGAEHATRHLIYARFWHKFLYDIGAVSSKEPFAKLQSVGLIMGEDGRKMSKRFGNVINPDDIVKTVGADTLRLYEMFMGPFDQSIAWSTDGIVGPRRFIERVWKLKDRVESTQDAAPAKSDDANIATIINRTIKKVTEDISAMRFNTAISSLMIAVNEIEKSKGQIPTRYYKQLLQLLAPFAPHATEELWARLGHEDSIHLSEWPAYDEALVDTKQATIIVQVNGKVRGSFMADKDTGREELGKTAQTLPTVAKWLAGAEIQKTIIVPGKLVNFVL